MSREVELGSVGKVTRFLCFKLFLSSSATDSVFVTLPRTAVEAANCTAR